MKTKTIFRKAAVIILSAILFAACSKEGPQGPQGPAGPQGEQGPKGDKGAAGPRGATGAKGATGPKGATGAKGATGPKGATGAKGATGDKGDKGDPGTANVIYSDWMKVTFTTNGGGIYEANIKAPKLTQDILDHGDIEVYLKAANGVYKVPYYYLSDYIGISVRIGQIHLYTNESGYTDYSYRYIIIPGGVHARRSAPLPDFKDYHAVCQYYGIPE